MHPFCCVSTVPDAERNAVPPSSPPLHEFTDMPSTVRSDGRSSAVSSSPCSAHLSNGHSRSRPSVDPFQSCRSSPAVGHSEPMLDHREVKLNDIVGNGISGILYKWVNYGRGWRPRWFVLQDGVLSYYKIHGPDKITVNQETEKGSRVIGEESIKRICRPKNGNSHLRRKPIGEVHLKVSSIRESRSDDKRFSIFTGTKRLHLRAETRDDRIAWMEALQAVKDMFPRMSNSELMAPIDSFVVSTEKLRQRLMEDGVKESAIQDSEQIMRNEFITLQNQLVLLKQKQSLLIDTLRQLETEKVDLENTLVDESQRQTMEHGAVSRLKNDKSSGKMPGSMAVH